MKNRGTKRLLALALSAALVTSLFPAAAFAAGAGPPCENHPAHTADCGYNEAVPGSPCAHSCDLCASQDSGTVPGTSGQNVQKPENTLPGIIPLDAGAPNGVISGDGYSFENGTLTITTTAGSRAWRNDNNIAKAAVTSLVLEDSVTSIGIYAFRDCTSLSQIAIPDSVTSIGASAFDGCTSLLQIALPSKLTSIKAYMFSGCINLVQVELPDGLETIDNQAFYNCTSLALTELPGSVTEIWNSAFENCSSLALKSFPSGLTVIRNSAFSGCTNLALTKLPDGVTEIEPFAFTDCSSLALESLPSGVTEIGSAAFSGCTGLTQLTIPSKVNEIGRQAFKGCTNLASLIFLPLTAPTLEFDDVFDDCPNLTIFIPPGATGYNQKMWTFYQGIIVTMQTIDLRAIPGVTAPATGAAPVTANFFTVAGATATNGVDSGTVTAVFPATGTAPSSGGGDSDSSGPSYYHRSLTDNKTGVKVEGGQIHEYAVLTVKAGALHQTGDAGCNLLRTAQNAGRVLSAYDVSLSRVFLGSVIVSLPVEGRDGQTLTVAHCINGKLALSNVKVAGGFAAVKTDSLSPFAVLNGVYTQEALAAPPVANPFTDIKETDWFYPAVMYVYQRGLMNGTTADTFAPAEAVTRAQPPAILYRLEGSPAVTAQNPFSDVRPGQWYAEGVTWAAGAGLVSGYNAATYGPGDPVTREQLVTILYRYAQYKKWDVSVGENTNILSYTDAFDISEWAVPAFQWACGAGIIQGDGGKLNPKAGATRAELAQILQRLLEKYSQPQTPASPAVLPESTKSRHRTVKAGDTLSRIASEYHCTVAVIVAANPIIKDPNFILPGWVLNIP